MFGVLCKLDRYDEELLDYYSIHDTTVNTILYSILKDCI